MANGFGGRPSLWDQIVAKITEWQWPGCLKKAVTDHPRIALGAGCLCGAMILVGLASSSGTETPVAGTDSGWTDDAPEWMGDAVDTIPEGDSESLSGDFVDVGTASEGELPGSFYPADAVGSAAGSSDPLDQIVQTLGQTEQSSSGTPVRTAEFRSDRDRTSSVHAASATTSHTPAVFLTGTIEPVPQHVPQRILNPAQRISIPQAVPQRPVQVRQPSQPAGTRGPGLIIQPGPSSYEPNTIPPRGY